MPGKSALGLLAAAVIAATALGATEARAEPTAADMENARAAYDRGAAASARGDHATAARELALADTIAPNRVALEAALTAALDADDAALGMELAARAEARGEGGSVAELAREARARFAGRAGPVTKAEATPPAAAGAETAPRSPEGSGLSPAWFVAGLALTAAAGGGAIASGLDTKGRHDDFVAARCPEPGPTGECARLADEGSGAQARTNVLIGVTAALGAATAVLGFVSFGGRGAPPGATSGVSFEARGGPFARLVLVLP